MRLSRDSLHEDWRMQNLVHLLTLAQVVLQRLDLGIKLGEYEQQVGQGQIDLQVQ